MGTRYLTMVYAEGEYKVAQYGQFDGYPEHAGVRILEFVRDPENLERLRTNLPICFYLSDEELEELMKSPEMSGGGLTPYEELIFFEQKYPSLHRSTGWEVLELIAEEGVPLVRSLSFAGDSLFCEWGYVVDLDEGKFEVYKGFNKRPTSSRSRFPSGADWLEKVKGYHPIRLKAWWPFSDLPTAVAFLKACQ